MLDQLVNDLNCFVLFLDNLPAHGEDNFKNVVAGLNGVAWFSLKYVTDFYYVVNAGFRQILKVLVAREH